jgi:hypothetical protein
MAGDPVTDDPFVRWLLIIGFVILVFGSLFILMMLGMAGVSEFAQWMFLLGEAVIVGIFVGAYHWSKRFLK